MAYLVMPIVLLILSCDHLPFTVKNYKLIDRRNGHWWIWKGTGDERPLLHSLGPISLFHTVLENFGQIIVTWRTAPPLGFGIGAPLLGNPVSATDG